MHTDQNSSMLFIEKTKTKFGNLKWGQEVYDCRVIVYVWVYEYIF